jgi:hypothetical protein
MKNFGIMYLMVILLMGSVLNGSTQDDMLCQGRYWTEDEGNKR